MRSPYLSVTINANRVEKKKAMVKKHITIALALLLSFFFKGCAVAPKKVKNPCLKANWSLLGQKIASNGSIYNWPPKSLKTCSQNKAHKNRWEKSFKNGYNKGLNKFCKARKGFTFGLQGGSYNNHCPKKLSNTFLQEYKKGLKVNHYKKEIVKIQAKISILKKSLKQSKFSRKNQIENFSKMESLYLKKREVTQFLKQFLEEKQIKSVKL